MHEQIHLKGKRMSGRGVRVRMLEPHEHGGILEAATKLVDNSAKIIELKKKEWRLGVKAFIVEFTAPCEEITKDTKWTKADPAEMDAQFDKIFAAKDVAVLEHMYREFHEVSEAEVEAIAGKALPVSLD